MFKEYKNKILLIVTGMSPQIVTETVYALTQTIKEVFVPTRIVLISTKEGADRARLDLFNGQEPKFELLKREYNLEDIDFDEHSIHIIKNENNCNLDDIRTEEDNMVAADQINHIVQELTQNEDTALHVSIAGGRKTMGYYLGYSMSLWGREQDRLSHVLVSKGFESNPKFWFPTKKSKIIHTKDGTPIDTKAAKVTLAEIPFVRLREELPSKTLVNKSSFRDVIKQLQPIKNKNLIFDYANQKIIINNDRLELEPSLLAFYGWLARRKYEGKNGVSIPVEGESNKEYAIEYLNEYRLIVGSFSAVDSRVENTLIKGMDKSFFEPKKSKLLSKLSRWLGNKNYVDFSIDYEKIKGVNYHQLNTDARNITWI